MYVTEKAMATSLLTVTFLLEIIDFWFHNWSVISTRRLDSFDPVFFS